MRIRNKLMSLFLAVGLIPALLIGGIIFYNSVKSLEEQTFRLMESNADIKVRMINNFFLERQGDLLVLQNREVIKKALSVFCQFSNDPMNPAYIEEKKLVAAQFSIVRKAYGFVDIVLINAQGVVVYVSNPEYGFKLNKPVADAEGLLERVKTGGYVGDVQRSSYPNDPYVLDWTGSVYGSANEFLGLVRVEVAMTNLYQMLNEDCSFKKTMEFLLVKKTLDNKVLFLSALKGDPESILRKTVDLGSEFAIPAQKAVMGETGSGFSRDYQGHDVLSAWRPIPALGWGLVAKVDVAEAFEPIEKLKKNVMICFGVVILLIILTAFAVAKAVADPIAKLRHGAAEIGSGHWDHELDIKRTDEIGELAKSFNEMGKNLKWLVKREKEFIMADARVEAEKQKAEELRALNQQLTASEQQLKAANQQQKAANQQLMATEQQLRAVNQQLLANEQQLRAAKEGLEQKVKDRTRELEESKASLEVKVQERTRALKENVESLEKMNQFMVDRELRVIELKKEINNLCKETGRPFPYAGLS